MRDWLTPRSSSAVFSLFASFSRFSEISAFLPVKCKLFWNKWQWTMLKKILTSLYFKCRPQKSHVFSFAFLIRFLLQISFLYWCQSRILMFFFLVMIFLFLSWNSPIKSSKSKKQKIILFTTYNMQYFHFGVNHICLKNIFS